MGSEITGSNSIESVNEVDWSRSHPLCIGWSRLPTPIWSSRAVV